MRNGCGSACKKVGEVCGLLVAQLESRQTCGSYMFRSTPIYFDQSHRLGCIKALNDSMVTTTSLRHVQVLCNSSIPPLLLVSTLTSPSTYKPFSPQARNIFLCDNKPQNIFSFAFSIWVRFPSPNPSMVTCKEHQLSPQSALHSRCHPRPPLPLLSPFLYSISAHSMLVSSDTAIAIAFGLLSTIISLLGVLVGYLTLRAMPLGTQVAP
jgi:hypothetical protein